MIENIINCGISDYAYLYLYYKYYLNQNKENIILFIKSFNGQTSQMKHSEHGFNYSIISNESFKPLHLHCELQRNFLTVAQNGGIPKIGLAV